MYQEPPPEDVVAPELLPELELVLPLAPAVLVPVAAAPPAVVETCFVEQKLEYQLLTFSKSSAVVQEVAPHTELTAAVPPVLKEVNRASAQKQELYAAGSVQAPWTS